MACKRKHKYLPFPIWGLCFYKQWVLVTGGGGGKNFGIRNKIMLCKPNTMEILKELDTGEGLFTSLNYSLSHNTILGCLGKDIAIFQIQPSLDITQLARIPCEPSKNVGMLKLYNKETQAITSSESGTIRLWKFASASTLSSELEIITGVEVSTCDCNSMFVCAALKNKSCCIYSAQSGVRLKTLQFGENEASQLMFKGCVFYGRQLLTLSTFKDGSYVNKWEMGETVKPVGSVKVSDGAASYMRLSRSGRIAGIGAADGSVFVLSVSSLQLLYSKAEFDMPATCLDFNPGETAMMVGAADYSYAFITFSGAFRWWFCLISLLVGLVSYFLSF